MHDGAKVASLDALKDFKAALCEFGEIAQAAMVEVDSEINRTITWLQVEQINYWQHQVRRRTELVGRAKSELYRRELSKTATGEKPSTIDQKKALQKAKFMLAEAQQKIENVKRWSRAIDREMNLYRGQVQQLSRAVETDLPRYIALMTRLLDSLDAYVSLAPPDAGRPTGTESAAVAHAGESTTPVSRALPSGPPDAVTRIVMLLRRRRPHPDRRAALPARDELPGAAGDADAPMLELPSGIADGPAPSAAARLAVEDGPLGTRLVLDRLDDPPDDDSGWTVARADGDDDPRPFVQVRADVLLRHRPELRRILSLPPGFAAVVSAAGVDVVPPAPEEVADADKA